MCNWVENSPPTCVFSPGILPVCLFLITSNMHTDSLNNFAHEVYICSGLLIYSLNVIVFIFFFPITKQLPMLQMWSEDLNAPSVCNGMLLAALPVPFLEWGRNTHRTISWLYRSVLHTLTSPEHPSPQSLGGPRVKVTICWTPCKRKIRSLVPTRILFISSVSWLLHPSFPFHQLKQPCSLHRKQPATSTPNPDCDCCFCAYSCSSYGFHKLQRSMEPPVH